MRRKLNFRVMIGTAFAAVALLSLSAGADAVQGDKKIRMYDDCDPASFNEALGPGTCVGNGHTTFDEFIEELDETQDAHAWRNQPSAMKVNIGRPTVVENRGGEAHTFTKVAAFGGGFVGDLNGISGNPIPAPECVNFPGVLATLVPAGGVLSGPTAGSAQLPVGTHKFQCCIHPWMRTVVEVLGNKAKANKPQASNAHHAHH